ncbi:MAG: nucleotidyltransferase domain-containing protein [Clostridia bacterium]|nr:nucleotidyltransferase domain-containing protein [Clostridia bacterium]MBQ7296621.1 nucleotidyltransferase domain-containing protein [Clostridia bacterium]
MCSLQELTDITNKVALLSKSIFAKKLNAVILYGSYARGDATTESDIDIMVLTDVSAKELALYKKPFTELTSELGLLYDVVVTVTLKDTETFNRYLNAVPFYEIVNKEGIKIAV